jgi:hypothetical protein
MPQPRVNTPYDGLSTKPKTQLLDDTLQHADDTAQLVGGAFLDTHERVLDPTSPEQRAAWDWGPCDNAATTGQYEVDVWQNAIPTSEFDPDVLSEKVRAYWESLGYRVRQIGPTAKDRTRHSSIIVDLPHGAAVSFSANTKILSISASSECTTWDD